MADRARVQAHGRAGADHVCCQVITARRMDLRGVRAGRRKLAAALP